MSLVQFVLANNFVVVGSDMRVSDELVGVIGEDCHKIVKLNTTIIGCSGSLYDSGELIDEFCTTDTLLGIHQHVPCNLTYNEIINKLVVKYQAMKEVHEDDNNDKKYDFCVIACGFNGKEFMGIVFGLSKTAGENRVNGIMSVTIPCNEKYFAFCIGSTFISIHQDNLRKQIEIMKPSTILQYKNIMKNVMDDGIKIDDTINNKYRFETIRRKEVDNIFRVK